ncbi:MAG: hypothetical protein HYS69_08670 [candidate division NC10 bacterium]|nr:hypothetical protein [candidate division NC10 bacterium]
MTDVSGLREIRSLRSTGKRSIPRVQSSANLDLYMLEKEKERLVKEAALLEKRSRAILKRLGDIQRQTETLEKSPSRTEGRKGKDGRGGEPSGPGKKWKTFSVNY